VIDLHLHTTASDGTLSPPDLVRAARAAGLSTISITDHDTVAGVRDARGAARDEGIDLVAGVEISAVDATRDVHVLGYFIDIDARELRTFLERQRTDRIRRVEEMRDRLATLGVPIDAQPIVDAAARGRSVGRPQIAEALVTAGHARTRDEAFERYLEFDCPAYVPRRGARPEAVIEVLHAAGGLASIAHPGVRPQDDRIGRLAASGLDAIEAAHPDHDAPAEARYRALAARHGLLITAGSDFHGEHRAPGIGAVTLAPTDFERLRKAAARRRRR
jgi:predicted metal-dependent phosphoesterase TrpH